MNLANKIVLIFSDENDWSTNDIIDWLHHFKISYFRIDINKILDNSFKISFDENWTVQIKIDNQVYTSEQILSIWYRRTVAINIYEYLNDELRNEKFINQYIDHIFDELKHTKNAFYNLLENKKWLNSPTNSVIDKSEILIAAKKIGILFPETIITNDKKELQLFNKKHKKTIVKPIYNVSKIDEDKDSYLQYTSNLSELMIANSKKRIFPTLCQKKIEKVYEVRVFYLDGKMYSMAIFSQKNKQTKLDFRRYDYQNPNRTVPYKLDENLERKIIQLMTALKLNSGSLDFIRSIDNEFYFLEVNPVGQFGMTSHPCNYYIERKIAEYLISN